MSSVVILAAALLASQQASASEWAETGWNDGAGKVFYIEIRSLRRVGPYIAVWEKMTTKGVLAWRALSYHNCAEGSSAERQLTTFDASGMTIKSKVSQSSEFVWEVPAPDTVALSMHQKVCSLGTKLPRR